MDLHMSDGEKKIHRRIVAGGLVLLVAFFVWFLGFPGVSQIGR